MPDPPHTAYPWDPHADPRDAVATAGAYFLVDGRFAFMIDPTPDGESLAVVRLGGRREPGETPWQCAEREVLEEAGLRISPRTPPCTYWLQQSGETSDGSPVEALIDGGWPEEPSVPAPILIVRGRPGLSDRLSAMYLAAAEAPRSPSTRHRGYSF